MTERVGVYWFTNDLRVEDNQLLLSAAAQVDHLICVYTLPKTSAYLKRYSQCEQYGKNKQRFLHQALVDLDGSLQDLEQRLYCTDQTIYQVLKLVNSQYGIHDLFVSAHSGIDERRILTSIQAQYPQLTVHSDYVSTLFYPNQLPFECLQLPDSFSKFRKKVERLPVDEPAKPVAVLPPSLPVDLDQVEISALRRILTSDDWPLRADSLLGGEQAGTAHCQQYFACNFASHYKATRNALDGKSNSTKFSPWLAHGCLSPKWLLNQLKQYEDINGANDSTYWIYFELLWREFFFWYAMKLGAKLFSFKGTNDHPPLTSLYPKRLKMWQTGTTAYPLVNALMHELVETGYMSNRGRQIVASCLVNELQLDWRYGAAFFEVHLIDYDVGSNWGNWQYLAGVGADTQPKRHFNIQKQAELFDPDDSFVNKWNGRVRIQSLDDVDIADWPR